MTRYRVQRIWTVEMESWCEVEASSLKEAKELALVFDDFYDQRILDGSDGPTEIGTVEEVRGE